LGRILKATLAGNPNDSNSEDVHAGEEAAALLATMPVQSSKSKLRGMLEDFRVFRIGSEHANWRVARMSKAKSGS
jgi:hypothetical protein